MKIISIHVGRPRDIEWRGETVRTSIFKSPVDGPVSVRTLNLEGDEQADLSVHGGVDKAVYAYPAEHYTYWRKELPATALPWGAFGENLTTAGLSEAELRIGDRLRVGTVEFMVTHPRLPCFKLNARFGRPDMVKRFHAGRRWGFYLAVFREGSIIASDSMELLPGDGPSMTVADIARLYTEEDPDPELLRQASGLADLPEGWRDHFRSRLEGSR